MAEQPTQKEFKTVDIVDYAMQGNPLKINDAFGHLISNKVVDSLATKKQEVSTKIFTDKVESEPVPIEEPEVETSEE
jgi:hypothetical protein